MKATLDTRAMAATAIAETLVRGTKIDGVLEQLVAESFGSRDKAFVRELCYGTLRWYYRFDYIADRLLSKPLHRRDRDVHALLLCGLYQLEHMRVPDHAAVSSCVHAARALGKPWAARVVNAILRRYQRERSPLMASAMTHPAARYAHPEWLIEIIKRDWPMHWEAVLEANNQRPPLHIRVNLRRLARARYLQQLHDAGRHSGAAGMVDTGVWLEEASSTEQIPGFAEGIVSVQDFAAQLAAPLLAAGNDDRVLDACSAPGGKTAHILESTPDIGTLISLDQSAQRLDKLKANLLREGLHAIAIQGDACHPDQWWDGKLFDKILLDAPCSATGVIRRHPDIKICRKPAQLPGFAATQRSLLEALWPLLGRNGRLLYSTCSVLRRENDAVIEDFINNHNDARPVPIDAPWGLPTAFGRQTLPGGPGNTDGFYYALLDRV